MKVSYLIILSILVLSISIIFLGIGNFYIEKEETFHSEASRKISGEKSLELRFVKKITVAENAVFPGILFTNNTLYITYTSPVNGRNQIFVKGFDLSLNQKFLKQVTSEPFHIEDSQVIYAKGYFYLTYSANTNRDLYLAKFDSNWNLIKKIQVVSNASENDPTNDMFLYYTNDTIYLGTTSHIQKDKEIEPFFYQRVRKYDLNLNFLGEISLSDVQSECGGSLLFLNDTFIFVSSDKFWGGANLIVLYYSSNWDFIGYKEISSSDINERFPMGFAYKDGYFYVAYTSQTELFGIIENGEISDDGNIVIKVFDDDWKLLKEVKVTKDSRANRAHLAIVDNRLFVVYDSKEKEGRKIFAKEYLIE